MQHNLCCKARPWPFYLRPRMAFVMKAATSHSRRQCRSSVTWVQTALTVGATTATCTHLISGEHMTRFPRLLLASWHCPCSCALSYCVSLSSLSLNLHQSPQEPCGPHVPAPKKTPPLQARGRACGPPSQEAHPTLHHPHRHHTLDPGEAKEVGTHPHLSLMPCAVSRPATG